MTTLDLMNLSIIIVNYNTGSLTQSCLESLLGQKLPNGTEIIVVDNASTDESLSFLKSDFPEVKFIKNKENKGLAFAVNQGIAASGGAYYLVLNPDIIALPGSVAELLNYMQKNPQVGMAGGKLIAPNGKLQYSCFRFYTPLTIAYRRTRLGKSERGKLAIREFLMKDFDHAAPRNVEWIMGSCMMARAKAVAQVGGMDERFFLYFEDVDWCRRFWEKGWQVAYVPSAVFSHFHQRSSRRQALLGIVTNWTTREHIGSAIKYFAKYRGKKVPKIA